MTDHDERAAIGSPAGWTRRSVLRAALAAAGATGAAAVVAACGGEPASDGAVPAPTATGASAPGSGEAITVADGVAVRVWRDPG